LVLFEVIPEYYLNLPRSIQDILKVNHSIFRSVVPTISNMRTVSTKIDNSLHDKFIDVCNDEGKCQSELLREMIQEWCKEEE